MLRTLNLTKSLAESPSAIVISLNSFNISVPLTSEYIQGVDGPFGVAIGW